MNKSPDFEALSSRPDRRSRQQHAAVLLTAVDLFIQKINPSEKEFKHFEELCLRLLMRADAMVRYEVSAILSRHPKTPVSVALLLACDDFSIAEPMIRHCQFFDENHLASIHEAGDERHSIALMARADIPDPLLMQISSEHREEPAPIIEGIPQDERTSIDIARLDLDIEPANPHHSSQEVSLSTLGDFEAIDITVQDDFQAPALMDFLAIDYATIFSLANQAENQARSVAQEPAELLRIVQKRGERAIDFKKLAQRRDREGFATLLGKEIGLSTETAETIIRDQCGFALAICLKSMALPTHTANDAFLLLNPILGENSNQFFLVDWFYGQISPAGAAKFIAHWCNAEVDHKKRPAQHVSAYVDITRPQATNERRTLDTSSSQMDRRLRNRQIG